MKNPINIGMVTLVGSDRNIPHEFGNCFELIDQEGVSHRVVNFLYENLIECQQRFNLIDINVELLPKSNTIWIINDNRIPDKWYNKEYCTVCTPLRMLPFVQRKAYLKDKKIKKCGSFILMSYVISKPTGVVYANYIPKLKNDN